LQSRTIPLIHLGWRAYVPAAAKACVGMGLVSCVMASAVWTKQAGTLPALVGLDRSAASFENFTPQFPPASEPVVLSPVVEAPPEPEPAPVITQEASDEAAVEVMTVEPLTPDMPEWDTETRWFDGRPIRPSKVVVMKVTGYSPDNRSCGEFADGQTATLHSVWTNAMRLVAADPEVLPYGSMITVPGYAADQVVPVLDCGGAIKGARLDLLFPTHERALAWGVRTIRVTVWEYADGEPAPNPRKVR
jgi:3D (Asp-Asp-Asp) domain-containing protein